MEKLGVESRKVAMSNLQTELEEAIGKSPQGLTEAEFDRCWQQAKEYWDITTKEGSRV